MRSVPVSVCIPTYNGAQYLAVCLESVLKQSFRDLEILIVDDCSSDSTLAIAQRYAACDVRIRIVKNEKNLGLVANWNRCIHLARGEWIKFQFQDDLLEPECIELMMASATRPMVFCRRDFIFEDLEDPICKTLAAYTTKYCLDAAFDGATDIEPEQFCRAALRMELHNFLGEPCGSLLHRDMFERFGFFDDRLVQLCDVEYWLRIGVNEGLIYVPKTLVHFRVHGGSTTAANKKGKRFKKDIVDKLHILYAFGSADAFSPLRRVASAQGLDLNKKFRDTLLHEQMWGPYWNDPGWPNLTQEHPHLRLSPLWRLKWRVRRLMNVLGPKQPLDPD